MILIFKANPLCLLTLSMLRFPASAGWVAFTKQILVFPLKDFCDFGDFCVTFAPFAFAPVFIAAQAKNKPPKPAKGEEGAKPSKPRQPAPMRVSSHFPAVTRMGTGSRVFSCYRLRKPCRLSPNKFWYSL